MSLKPHPPAGPPPRHLRKRAMLTGPPPPWQRPAPSPSPPPSPAARPTTWPVKKRDQYTPTARVHRQPGSQYNSAARPGSASDARHGSGSGGGARHAIGARPGDCGAVEQKCERRSNAQQLAYCSDVRHTRFIRRSAQQTRSAQQPAVFSHADRKSIQCEQPNTHHLSGAVGNKRIKCEQPARALLTSVVYLHLPEIPEKNPQESEMYPCAIEGLRQALEVGADVINMIFQRASDIDLVWVDLYEEMQANDQHPELQYRRLEQMLTIFSPNCGPVVWEDPLDRYETETGVPTICLIFSSGFGNMVVFNSACPQLSQSARKRMLDVYSDESLEQKASIRLIGGELHFLSY